VKALRDGTIREVLRLPERERLLVLGVVRQFKGLAEAVDDASPKTQNGLCSCAAPSGWR
jgi:hypothetical protein